MQAAVKRGGEGVLLLLRECDYYELNTAGGERCAWPSSRLRLFLFPSSDDRLAAVGKDLLGGAGAESFGERLLQLRAPLDSDEDVRLPVVGMVGVLLVAPPGGAPGESGPEPAVPVDVLVGGDLAAFGVRERVLAAGRNRHVVAQELEEAGALGFRHWGKHRGRRESELGR